jgi:two-component system sensor histidine kinase AtoS
LGLGRKRSGEVFSAEDIRFLLMVSNQIVIALENAKLFSEILEIKNYNEMLLSQMASGVVSVDPDLTITTCNPRASEILRLGGEVVGKKAKLLPKEVSELLVKTLRSEETTSNQEVWIKDSEGQFRCLNCSTSVLFERPGKKLGAMIIFNDLTRIKILEEEVKRAERLATVGTLAAGVAHEIKNPLVSLKTFAQLLPMKFDDMEFRNSFTKIAINEVERINNLVEKLLHFARPTKPDFHIYSMNKVIEDTIQLIQAQLDSHNVSLQVTTCEEQCMGYGDKEQIGQVLLNLLLNAIQAVEDRDDPRIEIRLEREGDSKGILLPKEPPEGFQIGPHFLKVTVKDNGKGISNKDLPRVFDPFFTTKPKGHGLGLSIAHKIVQDHFGKIQVESELNQYTEISIYLPELVLTKTVKEIENEVLFDRL